MKKYGGLEEKYILTQQKLRWAWNILHLSKVAYLRRKDRASYLREIQWQGRSFHTKCQVQYKQRNLLRAKRGRGGDKHLRGVTSCQTGWAYSKMYRVSLQASHQQCNRIALKPWCLVSFHCQFACFGKIFLLCFSLKVNCESPCPCVPAIHALIWQSGTSQRRNTSSFLSACKNSVWLLLMPWWQAVTWGLSQHKLGEVCWRQVSFTLMGRTKMGVFTTVHVPGLVQTCKEILEQCLFHLESLFDLIMLDDEVLFVKLRLGHSTVKEYRYK